LGIARFLAFVDFGGQRSRDFAWRAHRDPEIAVKDHLSAPKEASHPVGLARFLIWWTARTLKLQIPSGVLAIADEVIE
jgi:hypothetical protein